MTLKFCLDCKHRVKRLPPLVYSISDYCTNPGVMELFCVDLVNGNRIEELHEIISCGQARAGVCGILGHFWEPETDASVAAAGTGV